MSELSRPLFADLKLSEPLLRVLTELGYEAPSPIQAATIPILLDNRDVLGQAQTGTGKTAAFALPVLARIDIRQTAPQALVLAPTRELAIQVAEAFQRYATYIPDFHVLPIYGGQSYGPQLNALRRGVHVVVGTPGRIIDHLEKGSLDLSRIKTLVLDEADEMLRMGFIDDVEAILQKTPASRQTALFSATMPSVIKRIAQTYLRDPAEVTVAAKTGTADNIRQRYWLVSGMHKLDALTRILEAESFDGMIIFARTKLATEELAGKLQARGFSAAAINGDIAQQQRERTIQQLKDGKIDILVATDVAARGLDVERISHVINYDVPYDPESYTHRIGRTGRAGRSGEAILFIAPRERNLLKAIERATRQPISVLQLPNIQQVNDVRIARFKDQITETLAAGGLETFQSLIEDYEREMNVPAVEIASALAKLARGDVPLLLDNTRQEMPQERGGRVERTERPERFERPERTERTERGERPDRFERKDRPDRAAFASKERVNRQADPGMHTFRIEVGHVHGVKPGNIVGAIANETGLASKFIGRIEIYDAHSTLDLPDDMPPEMLNQIKTIWVAGQQLRISSESNAPAASNVIASGASGTSAASGAASMPGKATARPATPRAAIQDKSENTQHAHADARSETRLKPPGNERPAREEMPERGASRKKEAAGKKAEFAMQPYRIEVGHVHGVKPANIVGAIANEAGLEAKYIGRIEIFDNYSLLDLPEGMPNEVFEQLKTVAVGAHPLRISRSGVAPAPQENSGGKKITLTAPRKGVDRRLEEKKTGKPQRKAGTGFGQRGTEGKSAPKPKRKP
jgi:ATP-dependent RNA helicase DeaD